MTAVGAGRRFWKPGATAPGSAADRVAEDTLVPPPAAYTDNVSALRRTLPIYAQRNALLYHVETFQFVIVVGETGSGKTTQIPQYLHEAGWASSDRIIACTQPRRLAATSIAARVAQEMDCMLGQQVGYTIRFEDCSHPTHTKIKYLTDGMLLRECLRDPLLSRYSVVMVDEAHERGYQTDLLLGLLKKIARKRPELRIIVSSATMDALAFKDFFTDNQVLAAGMVPAEKSKVAILELKGRTFPVDIAYLAQPASDYVQCAVETVWKIHLSEPRGDILVFLTGRQEIDSALQALADLQANLPVSAARMKLLPLHAGLTALEQTGVFSPAGAAERKVVVATNIAEASVTLDGVVYVVDCGLVKLRTTSAQEHAHEQLSVVPISRASAVQRAGRAGRTRPGKCLRLYTEAFFRDSMQQATLPELARMNLAQPVLQLKALGVDNLVRFDYVPPAPAPETLASALQYLVALSALDDHARLTPLGHQMAELPLAPHLARILLAAATDSPGAHTGGCAREVLSILAMSQVTSPFSRPDSPETQLSIRRFTAQEGDLVTLLNVYAAFTDPRIGKKSAGWCGKHRLNFQVLSRAVNIRNQLEKFLLRFRQQPEGALLDATSSCGPDTVVLRKTLLAGLFTNLARYTPATMTFRTVSGAKEAWAHPTSVFFNRSPPGSADGASASWVMYGDAVETATPDGAKLYLRDLTVLDDLDWLHHVVPGYYDVQHSRT